MPANVLSLVRSNACTPKEFKKAAKPPRSTTCWSLLCDMHGDLGGREDDPAASWVRPHIWDLRIDVFWLLVASEGKHQLGLERDTDTVSLPMVMFDRWCVGCADPVAEQQHAQMFTHNFGSDFVRAVDGRTPVHRFLWHVSVVGNDKIPWLCRMNSACSIYVCVDEDFAYCRDPVVRQHVRTLHDCQPPGWRTVKASVEHLQCVSDAHRPHHAMQCCAKLQRCIERRNMSHQPFDCELPPAEVSYHLRRVRRLIRTWPARLRQLVPEWIQFLQQGNTSGRGVHTERITSVQNLIYGLHRQGVIILHVNICVSPEWSLSRVHRRFLSSEFKKFLTTLEHRGSSAN